FILQHTFTKGIKGTANLPFGTIWFYHAFPLPSQLQRWVMISPFITFNKIFYKMPKIEDVVCEKLLISTKKTQLNIIQLGIKGNILSYDICLHTKAVINSKLFKTIFISISVFNR